MIGNFIQLSLIYDYGNNDVYDTTVSEENRENLWKLSPQLGFLLLRRLCKQKSSTRSSKVETFLYMVYSTSMRLFSFCTCGNIFCGIFTWLTLHIWAHVMLFSLVQSLVSSIVYRWNAEHTRNKRTRKKALLNKIHDYSIHTISDSILWGE